MCSVWTVDNWLSLVTILFGVLGGYIAWRQLMLGNEIKREENRIKRAELAKQIIEALRHDDEMVQTMSKIDYETDDTRWYTEKTRFNGNNRFESAIDKLFSYMSYVIYLYETENIAIEEFELVVYKIRRICNSKSSQDYLRYISRFSDKNEIPCSFKRLIDYGLKMKWLPEDIIPA